MQSSFHFERSTLLPIASSHASSYASAQPFPHVVLNDFLPLEVIDTLVAAYPEVTPAWKQFDSPLEVKFSLRDEETMPAPVRSVIQQFNGQVFLEFLEQLTGIRGLIADPSLEGGGMHQIPPGGLLKIHSDFNEHPRLGLDRRLNALLYLNKDWDDSYGGHLELWNRDMRTAGVRIAPVANRLVVFTTSRTSYHGHPEPLTPPPGTFRRSLAWYYYTAPRRALKLRHSTMFQARPHEDGERKDIRATRTLLRSAARQVRQAAGSLRPR